MISLVYAQSVNGIIGDRGGLPWHIPSDLKRFKEITFGKPIIMGRKTWESLPRRPLTGRRNIVISRQPGFVADGADVARSLDDALALAVNDQEACVIGGAEIFRLALPKSSRIYLTEVDVVVAGDTPGPVLKRREWREVSRSDVFKGSSDSAAFITRVLERVDENSVI